MKEVSAFICVTPLQSFIARRVIQEQGITDYLVMNINPHDQQVTRNYFAQLAENAIEGDYLILNSRIVGNYKKVSGVLRKWQKYRIVSLYLASIDTVFAQCIIHRHPSAALYTFDDGSVNIIPSSIYHVKPTLQMKQHAAYFCLRRHKDQDWIKRRIIKHFTIYPGMANIVEATRLHNMDLFNGHYNMVPEEGVNKSIRVFLGFNLSPKYFSAVKTINPDIYLPHPMEKRTEPWINYTSTDLIAEEYLMQLLNNFKSIELYACNSSVLLNVRSQRIQKVVVDLYGNTSQLQKEYNEVATLMGCKILSLI
ncbi:MAG: glycosyltransferase family 52 protein [bacterium]|uniref:Glycosyltransferase family 52 protein n=1 Tax=Candidatus Methylomirabilis tolerans TaxID=3123416 RepID=A0AAJ1AJG5_9BACT|nr:glycosyltransferase family 52 protein [Candidatus Methylomirabilis sp.]